jgi:hypothetical protein
MLDKDRLICLSDAVLRPGGDVRKSFHRIECDHRAMVHSPKRSTGRQQSLGKIPERGW